MRLCVSRETRRRLQRHLELLAKWNPAINLVAPASLASARRRHLKDSAQLLPLAPASWSRWVDLGSGAGFPGLTVAILCLEKAITLIESDRRKAEFLRQAASNLGVRPQVLDRRIEDVDLMPPDVLSARALAPLPRLLFLARPLTAPHTVCLFPKGAGWRDEIRVARQSWRFSCEAIPSRTDPEAAVLRITDIVPA